MNTNQDSLDDLLSEEEKIILGESTRRLVHLLGKDLAFRRKNVKVRGVKESSMIQAVALGGLYLRLLELYPSEAQELVKSSAEKLAALIGR